MYGWDLNGNRTSASTYPADAAGACSTSTTAIRSTAPVFDAADRMIATGVAAGTAYDAWGRITTLPAGLTSTPVAGDAGASYYANDLVRSVSQLVLDAEGAPTTTSGVRTWTLDPAGRLAAMTSTGLGATALTNHYSDPSGDSPTWTVDTAADGTVTTRRYLSGPAGYLGEATTTAGSTTTSIGLAGLHGDILRTTTPTATASPDGPALDVDEFGLITNPDTATTGTGPRYGWLGTHQRATDTGSAGLTLMGVRLYAPVLGRFLSTDPVYGGNTTTYGYPTDPLGSLDLDGRMAAKCSCGMPFAAAAAGAAVRYIARQAGKMAEKLGDALWRSERFGPKSKLFGNYPGFSGLKGSGIRVSAEQAGKFNNYGRVRVGWSVQKVGGRAYAVFRVEVNQKKLITLRGRLLPLDG